MRTLASIFLFIALGTLCGRAFPAETEKVPFATVAPEAAIDRNVRYGEAPKGLPLPKTIIFSVTPEQLAADAQEWAKRGVTAFFLDGVAREWATDIWAADKEPWTIGESDKTLQAVRKGTEACRPFDGEVFLKVAFDHFLEWFNDTAWQRIDNNFRQFAIFARDSGCKGMAIDIEYVGKQYNYDWEGYSYNGYTRADLFNKVRERMTRVAAVLYDEFPDMVLLTFPECGLSLGTAVQSAWIEEAARRNAPGGVHYCAEGTYRNPGIPFVLATGSSINNVMARILPPEANRYWVEKCSFAIGVWPFGFDYHTVHSPGLPLEDFRQLFAGSLMVAPRYNWIYGHNCVNQLVGRDLDAYDGTPGLDAYLKVIADRQIITTPKYLELARDVRAKRAVDLQKRTDRVATLTFVGPEDTPTVKPIQAKYRGPGEADDMWQLALRHYRGEALDLHALYGTQTHWMIIGPFPNPERFGGHDAVYPPEQNVDLYAKYDGIKGSIQWRENIQVSTKTSVDLRKSMAPTDHATAYAFCYVTSPESRKVQLRLGTNDAGKLWVGGKLVYNHAEEGSALLDRDIVETTLPKGKTPLLLKVSNNLNNWGFVFRITDTKGRRLDDLVYSVR